MRKISFKTISVDKLNEKNLIIVSDVHLGYRDKLDRGKQYSNKEEFKNFLKKIIQGEITCDYFIILGDFLDMWRRDLVGVVVENSDVISLLFEMKNNRIGVYFVIGNHDYYLRFILESYFGYEFSFYEGLLIQDTTNSSKEILLVHGDEFDSIQDPFYYDLLCYSNDHTGTLMESAWSIYLKNKSFLQRIWAFVIKGKIVEVIEEVLKPAERRFTHEMMVKVANGYTLKDPIPELEKRVIMSAKERNNIIVFGHTHRPFLYFDNQSNIQVANTGTWVNDHTIHNTFIEIKIPNIALFRFKGERIEKLDQKFLG